MNISFKSEEEFDRFCADMDFMEHEAKKAGRAFDWDKEAEKHYPKFKEAIARMDAAAQDPPRPEKHYPAFREAAARIDAAAQNPPREDKVIDLSAYNNRELPRLPDEQMACIRRKRRKLLLAGPSKAGKTGLLMELALALVSGGEWLGFPCTKCRVLYIDLENDPKTSINRFFRISRQMTGAPVIEEGLGLLNWKGKTKPLNQLKDEIIAKARGYDVIILDPMYKVITGDENSATDMAYFCRQLDDIIRHTGATVIYCHHHSKGAQGQKKAMDRASGSGVFARDADALLDIIELNVTDKYRSSHDTPEGASAWRMEFTLREFAPHEPIHFWHEYPLHRLDESLSELYALGSREANLALSRKRGDKKDKEAHARQVLEGIFTALDSGGRGMVELSKAAEYANVSRKTIQRYIRLFPEEYENPANSGMVMRIRKKAAG